MRRASSLETSLVKGGALKAQWLATIGGGGGANGLLDGVLFSPAGLQVGSVDGQLAQLCGEGIVRRREAVLHRGPLERLATLPRA